MKYVALLRGINVGGKNIIPMAKLTKTFEELGFTEVKSYIQSGNVLFSSDEKDPRVLEKILEKKLSKSYTYEARVVVKSKIEMAKIIKNIPASWDGNASKRFYVLFLRHTVDSKKVLKELSPQTEIEEVSYGPGALYWSADIRTLSKSNMAKIMNTPLYKEVTIRNLNTTQKIGSLILE